MLLLLLFGMALAWFLQKKLYQKNWQKNLKIQAVPGGCKRLFS